MTHQERIGYAINKCISTLSRGTKDLNDAVARWGDGKDLLMDIDESHLILRDVHNEQILDNLLIASIRVWGVGRDNRRDFAFVARDKQTRVHVCNVFRCENVLAKEIANALRSSYNKLMNRQNQNGDSKHALFRPIFISDTDYLSMNSNMKCNQKRDDEPNHAEKCSAAVVECKLPPPIDEGKKNLKCRYLGCVDVNKPAGSVVLNEAIERIYSNATLDMSSSNSQRIGLDSEIVISPSSIVVREIDSDFVVQRRESNSSGELPFECRVKYISFLGMSSDSKTCAFITNCVDNTFKCHAFQCEHSAIGLCKLIEAACKLRHQKSLDAQLVDNASSLSVSNSSSDNNNNNSKMSTANTILPMLGNQFKSFIDSLKNRNPFSSH